MISETKIGIIGGGQLGKMMTQAAKSMGFYVEILDPTEHSPAGQVADKQIIGGFHDKEKIAELLENCDVVTYDLENVGIETLKLAHDQGNKIHPSPYVLEMIQNKARQKEILAEKGIPTAKFTTVQNLEELKEAIKDFQFPVVQKAARGGYDGKGVQVLRSEEDLEKAFPVESYLEEFVDFELELAVNITRSSKGEIKVHPVVEMTFDEEANICDLVIAPARISKEAEAEAIRIGQQVVEAFGEGAIGFFAIEMFLTKDGKILVNEIAPRPHNSGHYSIEGSLTSQFEQHIRAITGLPLGETTLTSPSVMINLLGKLGYEGPIKIEKLEELLATPGAYLHVYGKKTSKPMRKMGHVTVLDQDLEQALKKAHYIKNLIKP